MQPRLICICFFTCMLLACSPSKKTKGTGSDQIIINTGSSSTVSSGAYDTIQKKYAAYLRVEPNQITNIKLYQFIDQWLNTPYKWGGTSKKGVDCSSLIQQLLQNVYEISIPRTSVDQFFAKWINKFGSKQHLAEGDLVFFRTDETKIVSHVGLYLNNRMFVNSSSSKGVSIANLDDPYWKRLYVGAGRVNTRLLASYKNQ